MRKVDRLNEQAIRTTYDNEVGNVINKPESSNMVIGRLRWKRDRSKISYRGFRH